MAAPMKAGDRDHADLALAYLTNTDPIHHWGRTPSPEAGLVHAVVGLVVEQRKSNELLSRIADSLEALTAAPKPKRRWLR